MHFLPFLAASTSSFCRRRRRRDGVRPRDKRQAVMGKWQQRRLPGEGWKEGKFSFPAGASAPPKAL